MGIGHRLDDAGAAAIGDLGDEGFDRNHVCQLFLEPALAASTDIRPERLQVSFSVLKHGAGLGRRSRRMGAAALAMAPLMDLPAPVDDADLVGQVLAGRPDAFTGLVERYDRAVYHLALRTLRDPEEAKDVTQETFFKAYRSLHTYRPAKRFSTWIFAICYHAAIDRINRRKRYTSDEMPDYADTAPGPEALAVGKPRRPACKRRSMLCPTSIAPSSRSTICRASNTRKSPRSSTFPSEQ